MHVAIVKGCGECPFYRDNEYGQDWCGHPRADVHVDVDGPDLPAKCPLRRWSVLIQAAEPVAARCAECGRETCEGTHARPRPLLVDAAVVTGEEWVRIGELIANPPKLEPWLRDALAAEAPSAREHEPKQSIDVEPPREPLVTRGERDAAMAKALSCLIEDLAQWREERPTEGRERACCDLHSAKEEG